MNYLLNTFKTFHTRYLENTLYLKMKYLMEVLENNWIFKRNIENTLYLKMKCLMEVLENN